LSQLRQKRDKRDKRWKKEDQNLLGKIEALKGVVHWDVEFLTLPAVMRKSFQVDNQDVRESPDFHFLVCLNVFFARGAVPHVVLLQNLKGVFVCVFYSA
jgi:hypothetical protein